MVVAELALSHSITRDEHRLVHSNFESPQTPRHDLHTNTSP
jgi:hypothetical protein